MQKLSGQCLCGAIAYEVQGELGPVYNCHCSKCRTWHGAAFRTRASVPVENFRWLCGEEHITRYADGEIVNRLFCSICGSNLISTFNNNPNFIGLPLGGIHAKLNAKHMGHIFVASKAPWYEITDGLPQYQEWPGSPDMVRGMK